MTGMKLRALVVDDEAPMRAALARLLGARGFDVDTAATGEEAIALAEPGRFDLVILDLWMPGMNGLETLVQFRRIDSWVPVIAISAMGTDSTAEACRAAGATGFLPKPFTAEDIEQLVANADAGQAVQEAVAAGEHGGWRGRILVADDHESYRVAVARRLRLDGFEVDEVSSGVEVAMSATENKFDALLLDIHMPGGDGLMAAEAVRMRDPFLPIVFMTGEATESEMRQGLVSSTAGCLRKPVDMTRLARILEFLISTGRKSRAHAEAAAAYEALPSSRKAALAIETKIHRIRRHPETARIIIGITVAVMLALLFLSFFDAGQRTWMEARRSFEGVPGPFDMYRTIAGYLERDEQRELQQEKGRK
ncbi:MAG: response regulator [Candidatus Hydrogenedentota bacterium]